MISTSRCQVTNESYFSLHLGIIGMVQTISSWFGYKKILIADLKSNKTVGLMLASLAVLPVATILECLAACLKKGEVVRYYAIKG